MPPLLGRDGQDEPIRAGTSNAPNATGNGNFCKEGGGPCKMGKGRHRRLSGCLDQKRIGQADASKRVPKMSYRSLGDNSSRQEAADQHNARKSAWRSIPENQNWWSAMLFCQPPECQCRGSNILASEVSFTNRFHGHAAICRSCAAYETMPQSPYSWPATMLRGPETVFWGGSGKTSSLGASQGWVSSSSRCSFVTCDCPKSQPDCGIVCGIRNSYLQVLTRNKPQTCIRRLDRKERSFVAIYPLVEAVFAECGR